MAAVESFLVFNSIGLLFELRRLAKVRDLHGLAPQCCWCHATAQERGQIGLTRSEVARREEQDRAAIVTILTEVECPCSLFVVARQSSNWLTYDSAV